MCVYLVCVRVYLVCVRVYVCVFSVCACVRVCVCVSVMRNCRLAFCYNHSCCRFQYIMVYIMVSRVYYGVLCILWCIMVYYGVSCMFMVYIMVSRVYYGVSWLGRGRAELCFYVRG